LGEFLESGLGIDEEWLFEDMWEGWVDMREDEFSGSRKSMIQIEGSDEGLERIGEDVWILMSASIVFTTRELYGFWEVEFFGDLCEIATSYQSWSDIREFSFWFLRKCMIQCLCDDEFQYSISEVFESFIGLTISIGDLVENRSMDTGKGIEIGIFCYDLESSEQLTHLGFKLGTGKSDRDTRHRRVVKS
jgi:hypothetical protein